MAESGAGKLCRRAVCGERFAHVETSVKRVVGLDWKAP